MIQYNHNTEKKKKGNKKDECKICKNYLFE